MALTATYSDASTFIVDVHTSEFVPGRAVKADCGVDDFKYGFVDYSTLSIQTGTTVHLINSESDDLTANLVSVEFGVPLPDSEDSGNVSVFDLWALRGRQQIAIAYKDADEISLSAGMVHIDDGTYERGYYCPGFDKQLTSLSVSTWYAIYVKPPTTGLLLSATEVEYSTTMPGYVAAKQGWYHGTNTSWRCVGFVKSSPTSTIVEWMVSGGAFRITQANESAGISRDVNGYAPSNTFGAQTFSVPLPNITVICYVQLIYGNLAYAYLSVRLDDVSAGRQIGRCGPSGSMVSCDATFKVDSNKQAQLKWSAATTNTVYMDTYGFVLPNGIYNP